ncbi:unnamed protein product [Choristocarpus tenellus]
MPKMGLVLDETERGRADEGPDHLFYQSPRLCLHADHESLGQLSKLYKQIVPDGGRVLDLCSSWVSHLPEGVKYAHVEGHGMNTAELWCNYALDGFFKRDLNQENRVLPLDSKSMDAVLCCCGWQYLKYPEDIAREVGRVLVPGAPLVISFTDSCFPSKALQGWIGRDNTARKQLVSDCLKVCGFEAIKEKEIKCQIGGPSMSVVIGQAPSKPCHGQAKEMVEKQGTQGGPKIDASRLMGVLAAMPEAKQRWQARFYELTQAAESLGIPRYGMPVLLTSASETEIREAMKYITAVVLSYQCANI